MVRLRSISYSGLLCLTWHLYAIISHLSKKNSASAAWIRRRSCRIFLRSTRSEGAAIHVSEELKARRNQASEEIAALKKHKQDATPQINETKELREKIAEAEQRAEALDARMRDILSGIPNLPQDSVPVGKTADDNVEVRRWGTPPQFDFTPKPHWELGEQLGVLDLERAAKITGARFAVYWDLGAKLERALMNFMLDLHTREHGYTEVLPPFMVNADPCTAPASCRSSRPTCSRCRTASKNFYLIPTAEVPVTNLYRDETLDGARLPISLTAYTPCFRSEAGSYGKDVRGIIRQHQFQKVEMVKFTKPEQLRRAREADAQCGRGAAKAGSALSRDGALHRRHGLLRGEDVRHRGLAAGTGSVPRDFVLLELRGLPGAAGQHPLSPGRARKDGAGAHAERQRAGHGRTWVAIVENYQQADGSVVIPEVLRKYVGAERITAKKF